MWSEAAHYELMILQQNSDDYVEYERKIECKIARVKSEPSRPEHAEEPTPVAAPARIDSDYVKKYKHIHDSHMNGLGTLLIFFQKITQKSTAESKEYLRASRAIKKVRNTIADLTQLDLPNPSAEDQARLTALQEKIEKLFVPMLTKLLQRRDASRKRKEIEQSKDITEKKARYVIEIPTGNTPDPPQTPHALLSSVQSGDLQQTLQQESTANDFAVDSKRFSTLTHGISTSTATSQIANVVRRLDTPRDKMFTATESPDSIIAV